MSSNEIRMCRGKLFLFFLLVIGLIPASYIYAETFERIPNAAISGYNDKHLANVSVNDCKIACKNETAFVCKSFDYYKGKNKCDLSSANSEIVGNLKYDYANNPYDHYVRTNIFSRIPNAAISGYNNVHLVGVTAQQCRDACLSRTDFYCKSFDYYNGQGKCDLSSENASGAGGLYSSVAYDHHVREMSSTAKVTKFNSYQFIGVGNSLLWSTTNSQVNSNFWPGDWFKFDVGVSDVAPSEKISMQVIVNYNGDSALDIQESIYLIKNSPPTNGVYNFPSRIQTLEYTGNTKEATYYSPEFVGTCDRNSYATENPNILNLREISPPVAKINTSIYFKVFSLSTNTEIFSQTIPFLLYFENNPC